MKLQGLFKKNESVKFMGVTVFSYEGAIEVYKKNENRLMSKSEPFSYEELAFLEAGADQLHQLGFDWETIERFEIEAMRGV